MATTSVTRAETESPILEVEELVAGYDGVPVVHGASLRVLPGEAVSVQGSNGAGKSTLLAAISGVLRPVDQGSIRFLGGEIHHAPAYRVARSGLIHVLERRRLAPYMTVAENLQLSLAAVDSAGRSAWQQRMDRYLTQVPFLRVNGSRIARHLSGGQQQLVAIVRGLLAGPKLLMLDEPFQGLDVRAMGDVVSLLETVRADDTTIVFTEHRGEAVASLATRHLCLERGRIVA